MEADSKQLVDMSIQPLFSESYFLADCIIPVRPVSVALSVAFHALFEDEYRYSVRG